MWYTPLVVSLPIADRRAASAFYRDVLRLDPVGVPAEGRDPRAAAVRTQRGCAADADSRRWLRLGHRWA